ncbi:MAG: winged helix-turn-helix transcriptional regulator, partial [Candidatus Methanomethylophilus sp.]|nr:winged helix-turn-helix transcriptional regulator [Methanomethylophilus sp.]
LAGKNGHMREKAILDILSEYSNITRDDLADKLGISLRTLSTELKKLRDDGKLERIGGNRDGFWRVIRS